MSRILLLVGVNQRTVFTVGSAAELVFLDQNTEEEFSLPVTVDQAAAVLEFCDQDDEALVEQTEQAAWHEERAPVNVPVQKPAGGRPTVPTEPAQWEGLGLPTGVI